MKLKQLQEKRGSLVKQAREILDAASTDNRALNADESGKYSNLESEIEALNSTIDAEMRQLARESAQPVKLTEGEKRDLARFDYGRLLRHMVQGGQGGALDGIEAEMIQQGQKEALEARMQTTGIVLPAMLVSIREQRDLSVTGGTTTQYGGTLVQTDKGGLLGDFYNSSVLEAAGAMVLTGLVGNLDLPAYTAGTTPVKKTENQAAGDAAGTFASISLTPKRLPAYITISNQLLMQSSSVLESFLRQELTTQMTAVKEVAFFHGTGTSEANGIAAKSGIGSVVGGTNGAAPTWSHIVKLWKEVSIDNAAAGRLGYFTNPSVVAKLLQTAKVSSTDSQMVMNELSSRLLGFPVASTNAISSTLSKGSASGTASAIFFGNAADYVIGYWGGVELELVNDSTLAKAGQKCLVANTYYDGGLRRAKSFSAMLDALPA